MMARKFILFEDKQLSSLMIKRCIGVSTEATYELKKIDSDFFVEG
ncbi:hypothetical protein [Pelodictyon luteolum]|nr:hypothetical protein [Pelodictyon luteolum]